MYLSSVLIDSTISLLHTVSRGNMLRTCVILTLCVLISANDLFGPKYKPTKGGIWPKPQLQVTDNYYYKFNPKNFNDITITGATCDILVKAVERYAFVLRSTDRIAKSLATKSRRQGAAANENFKGYLRNMQVDLTAPCETIPYYNMNESYNLTVSSVCLLTSSSVWGILRGLESWVQLFYIADDEPELRINQTTISDAPRYAHRGLLIDTSRHFISLSKIQNVIDGLAMNKMNVLHWHLVDDQSFPYQSTRFPELSRLGAYHQSMKYTKEDIQLIINYATERGIRILPEFDVPGHTRSWGQSHPELLTKCYSNNEVTGLGPMDPSQNSTYSFLRELFTELQELFPDKYFHVGGDEVDLACWESNTDLMNFMRENKMKNAAQLHGYFMNRIVPMLAPRSTPIVWEEVFTEGVTLPPEAMVQVWKDNYILPILQAGFDVIYSTAWYLDHLKTGGDWEKFYHADPRDLAYHDSRRTGDGERRYNKYAHKVVGGEACMWAEVVDDRNFISRIFPRTSAVAEKLWSPPAASVYPIADEVYERLEEHYCRMNRRGIPAQPPNGPGFCLGAV